MATARKLATLAWTLDTRGEDYAFARPSLVAFKHRKLELTSGAPRRGAPWTRYAYNDKQLRREERELVETAERAYQLLISNWQPHRPAGAKKSNSPNPARMRPGSAFLVGPCRREATGAALRPQGSLP